MAEPKTIKDSERKKVIIERKFSSDDTESEKARIFSSTVIIKDGKPKLEQFRVPVGVEVELPVEIIAQIKGRGIPKEQSGKLKIMSEYSIEFV